MTHAASTSDTAARIQPARPWALPADSACRCLPLRGSIAEAVTGVRVGAVPTLHVWQCTQSLPLCDAASARSGDQWPDQDRDASIASKAPQSMYGPKLM